MVIMLGYMCALQESRVSTPTLLPRCACWDWSALCVQVRFVNNFSYFLSVVLGLFNALNGLGAGGQLDSATSANANAALYSTFAAGAFFSGYVNPHHAYAPSTDPTDVYQFHQQPTRFSPHPTSRYNRLFLIHRFLPVRYVMLT